MNLFEIKKNVSRLSSKEREQLAHWIISNFDDDIEEEKTYDSAWRREIRERVAEVKTGKVKMINSEDMWKEIFTNYVKQKILKGQKQLNTGNFYTHEEAKDVLNG